MSDWIDDLREAFRVIKRESENSEEGEYASLFCLCVC